MRNHEFVGIGSARCIDDTDLVPSGRAFVGNTLPGGAHDFPRTSRAWRALRLPVRHQRGFTLIEVLVAVVIFAIMAAMAYRGLSAILDGKRQVDAENDKWRRVAVLFTRLERDFAVAAPRPVRDAAQPYAAAMSGEAVANGEYGAQLAFTRMGSADDAGALGAPQRVGYRLRDGNVEVLLWPVLDQAPRTVPEVGVLIGNVDALSFSYLDATGQKQTRWPLPGNYPQGDPRLPNAVEVTLRLKSGDVLTRLFDLPPLAPLTP